MKKICLLLPLSLSSTGFASEESKVEQLEKKLETLEKRLEGTQSKLDSMLGSSAREREKKHLEFEFGSRYYSDFGEQIGLSIYDSSELKYSFLVTKIYRDDASVSNYENGIYRGFTEYTIKNHFIGGKISYFPGNSFYISSELHYGFGDADLRTITFDSALTDYTVDYSSKDYRSSFVGFSLGNSWSWETVTIDWSWLSMEQYFFEEIGGKSIKDKNDFHEYRLTPLLGKISLGVSF